MTNPKNIMVLGWTYRARECNHCSKWSTDTLNIMDLDNEDQFVFCHECYEALLGIAELHPCEGTACET